MSPYREQKVNIRLNACGGNESNQTLLPRNVLVSTRQFCEDLSELSANKLSTIRRQYLPEAPPFNWKRSGPNEEGAWCANSEGMLSQLRISGYHPILIRR